MSTHRQPGSFASLKSPFLNTDGKCIEFYYQYAGNGATRLEVKVLREDLVTIPIFQVYIHNIMLLDVFSVVTVSEI